MDSKEVQGLSLDEARKKLEELDRFDPPKYVQIPPAGDETAQHVIERRRLKGKHYTKEVVLSAGLLAAVTYFAWFFLRAQAESHPRPPAPEPAVVMSQSTPPVKAVPPPSPPPVEPKPAKPAARPKPAPAPEPTDSPELDPLINRTFRK
jgi:outer membrane biosynthesis protein TonB